MTTRARTSIVRWSWRGGDAELDHLGAEVVEVAADPRLRLDAGVELVAALGGGGRGAHPQRVQVVGDRRVIVVLGQEADREVHLALTSSGLRPAAPAK